MREASSVCVCVCDHQTKQTVKKKKNQTVANKGLNSNKKGLCCCVCVLGPVLLVVVLQGEAELVHLSFVQTNKGGTD